MIILDLFCGAGGLSEGFKNAGFNVVAGIDNDFEALETYSKNFPEAEAIELDLSGNIDFKNKTLQKLLKSKIDVIVGGFPCQGLSIAGKRIKEDPRNNLYIAYKSMIEKINPKAIVVENVPTILSLYKGAIAEAIIADFKSLGYRTKTFSLLASDYGVPQSRRRTFFIALKDGVSYRISAPTIFTHSITSENALSDLPLLENDYGGEVLPYPREPNNDYQRKMREGSDVIYNHWAVVHKKKTVDIISLVPDGGNYKDLPKHLQNIRKVNIAWTRMNSKKPCFTIDAGHNHHFHYKANRVPTVRECARIQSFPDRFRFWGKKTSQFKQVGNAVPPLLAMEIALELKEALDEL